MLVKRNLPLRRPSSIQVDAAQTSKTLTEKSNSADKICESKLTGTSMISKKKSGLNVNMKVQPDTDMLDLTGAAGKRGSASSKKEGDLGGAAKGTKEATKKTQGGKTGKMEEVKKGDKGPVKPASTDPNGGSTISLS